MYGEKVCSLEHKVTQQDFHFDYMWTMEHREVQSGCREILEVIKVVQPMIMAEQKYKSNGEERD